MEKVPGSRWSQFSKQSIETLEDDTPNIPYIISLLIPFKAFITS